MYGPVATNAFQTQDLVAPGMPIFTNIEQTSNTVVKVGVALPSMDADGGNLSGLTKLTVATIAMADPATNPFAGKSMVEILALAGVSKVNVTVTASDAGQEKSIDVPVINLGGFQAFAAACSD